MHLRELTLVLWLVATMERLSIRDCMTTPPACSSKCVTFEWEILSYTVAIRKEFCGAKITQSKLVASRIIHQTCREVA